MEVVAVRRGRTWSPVPDLRSWAGRFDNGNERPGSRLHFRARVDTVLSDDRLTGGATKPSDSTDRGAKARRVTYYT
eukprot:g51267.t1